MDDQAGQGMVEAIPAFLGCAFAYEAGVSQGASLLPRRSAVNYGNLRVTQAIPPSHSLPRTPFQVCSYPYFSYST